MPALPAHLSTPSGKPAAWRRAYLTPKSVKPRIRRAIQAMVWQGLNRAEAAASVGLKDQALYKQFVNPDVLKYYQHECEMLRSGQRHMNLQKAILLRDGDKSGKVQIEAMKFLENDYSDDSKQVRVGININVQPGYICDISPHADKAKQLLQLGGTLLEHKQDQ